MFFCHRYGLNRILTLSCCFLFYFVVYKLILHCSAEIPSVGTFTLEKTVFAIVCSNHSIRSRTL